MLTVSTPTPPTSPGTVAAEVVAADLAQLQALPVLLHELADQVRAVASYAGTWVCATDGFEPSPVCVLRPLAPVLRGLEEAFLDVGGAVAAECALLAEGLELARAELVAADVAAVAGLAASSQALGGVAR